MRQYVEQVSNLHIQLNDLNGELDQIKTKQELGIQLDTQESFGDSNWEHRYQSLAKQYTQLSNDLLKIHKEKLQLATDLEVTTADNEVLNRNASLFEGEITEAIHQKEIADGKVIDMQVLLNTVEMNMKLHSQQQRHLSNTVDNTTNANKRFESEVTQLKSELSEGLNRESHAKQAFDEIVTERDVIVDKLNEQYDVYHVQLSHTRTIEDHNMQLKEVLERQEKKCRNIEMDFVTLQRQYAAFEMKFSNSKEENSNLKRKLQQQNGDLTGMYCVYSCV